MRRCLGLVIWSACASLSSCATRPHTTVTAPEIEPLHRVVVLSTPRGAPIVLNGTDTLTPAPIAFPLRRGHRYGYPSALLFEALPADSGQCVQAKMVDFDAPTPDTVRFDMHRCPPAGLDWGAVFDTAAVTDQPIRVWLPAARYPDALRQAGIQGRVVVECVIDTTGRAEPASVQVLEASHPQFGPPTVEIVLNSRFWPARITGRKVRVRVQIPVNFTISRSR